jgi:hypothetical protein
MTFNFSEPFSPSSAKLRYTTLRLRWPKASPKVREDDHITPNFKWTKNNKVFFIDSQEEYGGNPQFYSSLSMSKFAYFSGKVFTKPS